MTKCVIVDRHIVTNNAQPGIPATGTGTSFKRLRADVRGFEIDASSNLSKDCLIDFQISGLDDDAVPQIHKAWPILSRDDRNPVHRPIVLDGQPVDKPVVLDDGHHVSKPIVLDARTPVSRPIVLEQNPTCGTFSVRS